MTFRIHRSMILVLALFVSLFISINTFAANFPIGLKQGDYLTTLLDGAFFESSMFTEGTQYKVTALAYEAGWNVSFNDPTGTSLFKNRINDTPNAFGTWVDLPASATSTYANAYFSMRNQNGVDQGTFALGDTNQAYRGVKVYKLTQDWVYDKLNPDLTLYAGTLIFGLDDGGYRVANEPDYNDFILAAAPVPIPGAVWLLGSGLLGLIGLRRKLA